MSQTIIAQAETPTEAPAAEAGHGEAGHSEGTAAEGGHGGGVFPPLDTATFPSQLFWLVIFFALLYVLMSKVALPRLAKIFHDRMARINGDLSKAQALKEETEAAVKAYEKALADAKAKATTIAQDTRDKLMAEVDSERAALERSLGKKIAESEAQIAKSRAKAMGEVDKLATETAATIIAELTGTTVSKTAVAKAVADAVKG